MIFTLRTFTMAARPARPRADYLQGKPWPLDSVLSALDNHRATLARLTNVALPCRALSTSTITGAPWIVIATGLSARAFRVSVPIGDIDSNHEGTHFQREGEEGARELCPFARKRTK